MPGRETSIEIFQPVFREPGGKTNKTRNTQSPAGSVRVNKRQQNKKGVK
jgi:hypothetical protein